MTKSISFNVPAPPSLNNMFVNVKGRGRVPSKRYTAWRTEAGLRLNVQHPGRIEGPVGIWLTIEDAGRTDLDNFCKSLVDLCVSSNLIDGDGRRIVRSVNLEWGKVSGAQVLIRECGTALEHPVW